MNYFLKLLIKPKSIIFFIAVIALLATLALDLGMGMQSQVVLAITIFVSILWFTETFPLHISGLLAVFLLVIMGGFTPKEVFAPFFDPVVVLILGGFVLGLGMQKHKLDEFIALKFLNKVGSDTKFVILGLMIVTAFLSFWITNTASTTIILPIAIAILAKNKIKPLKSNFGKATVLGIAYSATIGGMATLIGTTPNPIAVKFLADSGIQLSFLEWMFYGVPMVVIMIPIAWIVIIKMFKPELKEVEMRQYKEKLTKNQKLVFMVFALTIFFWLIGSYLGLHSSVVALIPILLLYALNLLKPGDLSKIKWGTLLLFGSGLSLGTAIFASGLGEIIASYLLAVTAGNPFILIVLILIIATILLTAFASNTATAVILMPIILPLASTLNLNVQTIAIVVALAASLDFIVPVGTPPDTIAYYSGYIRMKDMVKAGLPLTLIGITILTILSLLW